MKKGIQEFKAELLERIERVPGVESFRFKKDVQIDFIAGQFVQIIFDEKDRKNKELNKFLSISTGPASGFIEFTKKLSESSFSSKLKALKEGDKLLLSGPLGRCTYENGQAEKIGFLVGGIGITPVISILEYILSEGLSTDVLLVYSNWAEKSIAFKQEMDAWVAENPRIKILHVLSSNEGASNNYLTGRIDADLLRKNTPDIKERLNYIFGPPKMVAAMKAICDELNIEKAQILSESFMGY